MNTRLGPLRGAALILALVWLSGGSTAPSGTGGSARQGAANDEVIKVRPGTVPAVEIHAAAPPEPLVAPGPAPDLEILLTSVVQGYYQPCG